MSESSSSFPVTVATVAKVWGNDQYVVAVARDIDTPTEAGVEFVVAAGGKIIFRRLILHSEVFNPLCRHSNSECQCALTVPANEWRPDPKKGFAAPSPFLRWLGGSLYGAIEARLYDELLNCRHDYLPREVFIGGTFKRVAQDVPLYEVRPGQKAIYYRHNLLPLPEFPVVEVTPASAVEALEVPEVAETHVAEEAIQ